MDVPTQPGRVESYYTCTHRARRALTTSPVLLLEDRTTRCPSAGPVFPRRRGRFPLGPSTSASRRRTGRVLRPPRSALEVGVNPDCAGATEPAPCNHPAA